MFGLFKKKSENVLGNSELNYLSKPVFVNNDNAYQYLFKVTQVPESKFDIMEICYFNVALINFALQVVSDSENEELLLNTLNNYIFEDTIFKNRLNFTVREAMTSFHIRYQEYSEFLDSMRINDASSSHDPLLEMLCHLYTTSTKNEIDEATKALLIPSKEAVVSIFMENCTQAAKLFFKKSSM